MPLYFQKEFKERPVMWLKNCAERILEIVLVLEKKDLKKLENKNGQLQRKILKSDIILGLVH